MIKGWLSTIGDTDAVFHCMRQIREQADYHLVKCQELTPKGGAIAVGGAHFDEFVVGEALSDFLGCLSKGMTPQESSDKAKAGVDVAVEKWNSRRKKEYQVHRPKGMCDTNIDWACRNVLAAVSKPKRRVMSEELYKKYRPQKLSEVVGQDEAIRSLVDMGKRNAIPHMLLFTGPSGCGKTTIARILRRKLKCSDIDFNEVNAASTRGIDSVREIASKVGLSPLNGSCRVWLVDECHALTSDAQDAFLKLLEDTPKHVYFMFCTTTPQKLKKTIKTRSTEIRCKSIGRPDLIKLLTSVVEKEQASLDEDVIDKIAAVSEGSARAALVVLHQIIGLKDKDKQLKGINNADITGQGFQIARALMHPKCQWPEVQELLRNVDVEAETIRRIVLSYCNKVLLGKGNHARAALIIEEFREPLYDIGEPGLTACCYNVIFAE